MLANQSIRTTQAPSYNYPGWRTQAANAYISGFKRAYDESRALLHRQPLRALERRLYMDAVEEAFKYIAREKEKGGDVRLVSFRQFTDWLDVQKPETVRKLQTLDVGSSRRVAGRRSSRAPGGCLEHPVERRLNALSTRRGCARSPDRTCETFHMSAPPHPQRLTAPVTAAADAPPWHRRSRRRRARPVGLRIRWHPGVPATPTSSPARTASRTVKQGERSAPRTCPAARSTASSSTSPTTRARSSSSTSGLLVPAVPRRGVELRQGRQGHGGQGRPFVG